MIIEESHIDKVKTDFSLIHSKVDLLNLMNWVKPLLYGDNTIPFELKQLTWYSNPRLNGKTYKEFTIKKKSGGTRIINAPVTGLKAIQRTISFILQCVFEPHKSAMGFVRGKSIVDNAKLHVHRNYVFNIDLKDFFSSIDQARVWKCLQLEPFNLKEPKVTEIFISNESKPKVTGVKLLNKTVVKVFFDNSTYAFVSVDKGFKSHNDELIAVFCDSETDVLLSDWHLFLIENKPWLINNEDINTIEKDYSKKQLVNILAAICCTEIEVERIDEKGEWQLVKRNVLPQGAPTSPVITNIVCQKLDFLLTGVAKRFGLRYSRYADDITFSSMHNVYQPESDFLKELHRIIAEQNFHIKESKTRLQKDGYRKEVTGLLVNEKANVQQRYIKQLRMWLYYWERYGYERASAFFLKQYVTDKGHLKNGKPDMANVISGKLDYLKMVKGADNELYQKLKARFENITGKITSISKNLIEVEEVENINTPLMKLMVGHTEQPIVLLEEKIINDPSKAKTDENTIPVLHKPKELVSLLKKFSVNDSALKYTTHSWDAGRDKGIFKDLEDFLQKARQEYSEFSFLLHGLSRNLNAKIYNFLFEKEISHKGWGEKRIKFGWSSPELMHVCKNNPDLIPEDYIIPEEYQLQVAGQTIQKFKQVINIFKNEIEIRDENSVLENLILKKHDRHLISFSPPKIINLENKSFYTDIQWLSKALDLIFKGIQDRPQHRVVEYFVTENNNEKLVLNILHKESFKRGTTIYDEKLNLTRGDFGPIKDYLTNLCDWSIESEFAEGAYRINYLVSDNEIPAYEKIMSAEGFKHIFTFYK